jgi:ribosome modulation factor
MSTNPFNPSYLPDDYLADETLESPETVARLAGIDAYHNGDPETSNPYADAKLKLWWTKGFREAQADSEHHKSYGK